MNEDIEYKQSLQGSRRTPLLFYDAGTRIGWLVPELSVILHLALANVGTIQPLPRSARRLQYAEPMANGGATALAAIHRCDQVVLWNRRENENRPYRFMDVLMHYRS
jgi:hypothetical protein